MRSTFKLLWKYYETKISSIFQDRR